MYTAQLAGAVEYTNCIFAEGNILLFPNKCPGYVTDGEALVLETWRMWSTP